MKTSCCHSNHFHNTDNGIICLNETCENYLAGTTTYKDFNKYKNPVAITIFSFLLLFSLEDFSMEAMEQKVRYTPTVNEVPLTLETLHQELIDQEVLCPDHVFAQIRLESGNLKSFLLKRTNNMLGMRYPGVRQTTACGMYIPAQDTVIIGTRDELRKYMKTENYAVYSNWKDAVADYKLWQESNFNVEERYLTFLGKVYAEDADYIQKIKQMADAN